ncbi:PH domain-containing protein [Paenibacillus sp. GCM10023252]|uniref:PH domain-containing protein n=1 Tax=Paenibacillus sp. GCM10023252 TaxID=3252649 RepID=UPI00361D64EE
MNRSLTKRLHRDYLTVSRISSIITHAVLYAAAIGYLVVAAWQNWTLLPVWIMFALITASLVGFAWLLPAVRYRRFVYELFDDELEIQYGIFYVTHMLVPMVRVQHVELESGPLMRKYDLASVSIVTAATTHRIRGLKQSDAHQLKRRIGILARVELPDE